MKIERLINRLNGNFISKQFRASLHNSNYHLLCNTRIRKNDIEHHLRGPITNDFTKITLHTGEHYVMYLIRWGVGNELPKHYHGGMSCVFKQIDGKLEETLYSNTGGSHKHQLSNGEVCFIDDTMGAHSLMNKNDDYSYSLHIYYHDS